MAQSNRHWPSMFKSKPCTATGSTTTHHHNPASHLQHDINSSLTPSAACKIPFSTGGGCDERSPEPKPRWNPKPEQIRILEAIFNSGMVNPPRDEIRKIRTQLQEYGQVGDANVFYWFQNRKSRSKHKNRHLSKSNTANNNNTIHNNNNQTTTQSPNSLHGTATASALAAPAPTSSSSSSEKSYYPRDKILKMSTTNNNNNNVGVDVSNLNSPTGSVNQTYLQAHLMNDYFHQAEPQQQFFFPVQQSGTIVTSHLHHPAYSTQQTALCFNDLSAGGGGSTSSGSVVTGGGGSSGIEQQRGGIGCFSSLLLGEMIGGGGSAVNNNNSPVPPATVNATRRGEVVVGNDEEEKLNFHHHQQQQGLCFFVTNTNPAATTNTINSRPAVALTTSISSLSQIQGVGDQSNAVVDPPLKSTVFINDVAFDVPVGPFNVRDAFGDDALLVNAASGQPVLTNEWGITLQSLLHGGSYYLVRALPATPAILFDRQHDQTDLLAQPEFPFQI